MCGIVGLFSNEGYLENKLNNMTRSIYHRGPDELGKWINDQKNLGFSHTRLSILDLSSKGHQPMIFSNNNLVIVFNGEIFNFKEIRKELVLKGYSFSSNCDTEVVLAAYHFWGEDCVKQFNGMWAFCIYNIKKETLFLSRDRIGIKPLYYYKTSKEFIFGSEIKSILGAGVQAKVDYNGLNEYFTFQNIISDRTLFDNIKMLKAGHNLRIDLNNSDYKFYQYWDMKYKPENISEEDLTEELFHTFKKSMSRHLISDVDVGCTLSGGMDSSAIVAVASEHFQKLNTFTGYFDTSKIDKADRCVSEREYAKIMSDKYHTIHHEREINYQDLIDTLPSIVWHLEDPKVGMCYTFYNMSQLVSSHVTVNLSGTGGDEIFAGYPWRYSLIENITDNNKFDKIYFDWWSRLVKTNEKNAFFTNKVLSNTSIDLPYEAYKDIINNANGFSPINKALYYDLKTFLHGFVLVEDKMGMAYSIETRFPFLDKEMLDFMQKVPDSLKYKDGNSKYILKKAMEHLLPKDIIYKRKQGFTPPDRTWYKKQLKDYINQLLLSKKSCIGDYINPNFIKKTIEKHENGGDERLLLWSMMFFEGWCRTFLVGDREPSMRLF